MQGASSEVSSLKPPGAKAPKEVVPFRCDVELLQWLETFVRKPKPKISEICNWAVGMGRLHYDAFHSLEDEIQAAVKAEGGTEAEVLNRLVRLGLSALERERRGKK